MTSARNEIMFAVSRTVSPWAIWDLPSSRSASARPRALAAEAKLKRVRVELSRKMEIASPVSKTRNDRPSWCRAENSPASSMTARSSSSVFSQVRRKSFP